MTRAIVGIFLLAILAGTVGALIALDPGYVLLVWSDFSFETSFWFAGVLLLLALLLLRGLVALFELFFGSRHGVRAWTLGRRQRRAERRTTAGLLAMARGDYASARKTLVDGADNAPSPLLNHLQAARAAQALDDLDGRDALLRRALEVSPDATLPVGLAQARLRIEADQWEQALAGLTELRREAPRNAEVLRLLWRAQEKVGDWEGLLELLPDLRKASRLPEETLTRLEREARIAHLGRVGGDGDDAAAAVKAAWEATPKALRADAGLIAAVARRLDAVGAGEEAEALLREVLQREWNPALVELYGRLDGGDVAQRAKTAARWAKAHQDDAMLELTRARLALRAERFGEARNYYVASLALRETPEACAELGRMEARLGAAERGAELLDRALALRASPLNLPLPPGTETAEARS